MEIIILIIIFILAGFIMRGLFDSKWRKNAQEKFDSIKKEKRFWYLMKTEDVIYDSPDEEKSGGLNIRDVFRLYIFGLTRELIVGDFYRQQEVEYNNLDKKIVKEKNHWIDNTNLLVKMIKEKEKLIEGFLEKNKIDITKSEIQKKFEEIKEESFSWKETDRFASLFLRFIDDKNSSVEIWLAMKKFKDTSHNYEFDSAGENISDMNILASIKFSQFEIFDIITNILCERIEDKAKKLELKKLFQEYEQMEMLSWCMINYSVVWINTNSIQRFGWRIINTIFL